MKSKLQRVYENGKPVWRIRDNAEPVMASCPACENINLRIKKPQGAQPEAKQE